MKWKYLTSVVQLREKCKQCERKTHWELDIQDGKHHWLTDGLNLLGEQGWELVAVQQNNTGGAYNFPTENIYVFRKPSGE